ncbi:MAG: PAS domain S-box protein [Actinobacteria bacterium]|nr:PAS domain S-box protein [Actinomycetota bacterium]
MKIQKKLQIIALSLLIAVSVTYILISRNISTNIIKEQITNNLINTAQSRAEHIKTFLDLEKETVKQSSESIVFRELLLSTEEEESYPVKFNKVMQRLQNTAQVGEYTYDSFVLDTKGTVIASSYEEDIGQDKSNDTYFLGGKEDVFIKGVYISSHKQRKTLAFSAPILDEDNKLLGVIVFRVSAEPLFKITTNHSGLGETGEAYLVNKDGYMITPSRFIDEVILKQKVDLKDIEVPSLAEPPDTSPKEEVDIIKDYRGIEVLSVHTHIPEMNWHLIAEIDVEEAFAPVTKLTQTLILVFVIILLFSILISSFTSRTITRPLRRLYEGIKEIMKGNLNYKVSNTSTDEVGQLSRAFDEMTVNLKKSREELEEYSRNLEKKVKERTRDLEIDIEKRKKTEKELDKSQQEFASLFTGNPEALVYIDEKSNILDINSRFTQLFGYSLKEIKGKNINSELIHPSVESIEEGKILEKIVLSKGYVSRRKIRRKKDGTLFPVSISASPIMINNQVKGILGLYEDITEQVQNEERLQDYLKEIKKDRKNLKRLSKKLINTQEEERRKISETIHDDIGQNITAIKINISVIEEAIKSHAFHKLKERLLETKSQLEQVFEQLRKLNIDLRSPLLRDLGLVPALSAYVNSYKKRENIDIDFEVINLKKRLNKEIEIVIFRIVQEAFTNISKHACADNIYLRLENKKSKVCVLIKDNGKGFNTKNVSDLEELSNGLGLIEMRERIETIGGNLDIKSSLRKGTQLLIEMPVALQLSLEIPVGLGDELLVK